MPITALPAPPLRSDPSNFSSKGDTFMAALPQFVTEANLLEANTQASALFGTSTSSLTIGIGSKTFTTQTGKAWTAGTSITIVSTASPTNLMYGTVTSYSGSSLVVNVTQTSGSGTLAAWSIQTSAPIPTIPDDPMDGGTTAGTSTAYTLAPTKPLSAYTANKSYMVIFNVASGNDPTLTISGLGTPPTLVKRDYTGAYTNIKSGDISANWKSRVTLVSTTQALVEDIPEYNNILDTTRIDVASAGTVNLTTSAPNTRNINITGTTTITAFTVAIGKTYFVRFAGALTLTNNANIVTQTGANITTVAGDTCIIRATAANTVEVLSYARVTTGLNILAQVSASGTSVDFTGIPSTVKRITVLLEGISTNGTSVPILQIGPTGGVETSGYLGDTGVVGGGSGGNAQFSSGVAFSNSNASADVAHGQIVFTNMYGDVWVISGTIGYSNTNRAAWQGGVKTLAGDLSRVRLTTVNGTDTFDAGNITLLLE